MKNTLLIAVVILMTMRVASAQMAATAAPGGEVAQNLPYIMVIPRIQKGEDIRTLLDQNQNLRIAVTKLETFFHERGYPPSNFVAKLQAIKTNQTFVGDNQSDLKTKILEADNPDVYVQIDAVVIPCEGASIAHLNVEAYYTATGASLGSMTMESPCNRADYGQLVQRAINDNGDNFLNMIQRSLAVMEQNGVPVYVEIGLAAGSTYKMNSPVGEAHEQLSDVMEDWFEKNAFKNQYRVQGNTTQKMILSEVRIPLRDQATGSNYSANKFARAIAKYMGSLGLNVIKDVRGMSIYLTIQ
jgi:hypothetical protein